MYAFVHSVVDVRSVRHDESKRQSLRGIVESNWTGGVMVQLHEESTDDLRHPVRIVLTSTVVKYAVTLEMVVLRGAQEDDLLSSGVVSFLSTPRQRKLVFLHPPNCQ